jgi:hypothetical protein
MSIQIGNIRSWILRQEEALRPNNAMNRLAGVAANRTHGEGLGGLFRGAIVALGLRLVQCAVNIRSI